MTFIVVIERGEFIRIAFGQYRTLKRAEADANAWHHNERGGFVQRAYVLRILHPDEFIGDETPRGDACTTVVRS